MALNNATPTLSLNNATSTLFETTTGHISLAVLQALLIVMGIVLHCIGLFLFHKLKENERRATDVILIHLSIMEIITLLSLLISLTTLVMSNSYTNPNLSKMQVLSWLVIYVPLMLTMVLQTADRVLAVYLTMKYPLVCTRERYTKAIILVWVMTLILAGITYATAGIITKQMLSFFNVIQDLAYLVVMVAAYAYIIISVHIQRKALASHSNQSRAPEVKFKVPLAIVLTYTLLMLFPHTFIYLWAAEQQDRYMKLAITLMASFNNLSDAFIYIYFQQKMRKLAKSLISRCGHNRVGIVPSGTQKTSSSNKCHESIAVGSQNKEAEDPKQASSC